MVQVNFEVMNEEEFKSLIKKIAVKTLVEYERIHGEPAPKITRVCVRGTPDDFELEITTDREWNPDSADMALIYASRELGYFACPRGHRRGISGELLKEGPKFALCFRE